MASSNPFRKPPSQENRLPAADHADPSRSILASRPSNADPLAARGHARKKSSKKVRVLSPPPRSPERRDSDPPRPRDPLPQIEWPTAQQEPQSPANPFSGAALSRPETDRARAEARRSLNVDSFRRLLLTGAASPPPDRDPDDALSPPPKKPVPPPPPSSRHGRSLKPRDPPTALPGRDLVPSPSPVSSSDGDSVESVAAPDPTPSSSSKKPVPAPPPPRGHSRAARSVSIPQDSDPPSRTSLDSDASPPASPVIRQGPPPPPRRPSLGPPHRPPSVLDAEQEPEQEPDHAASSLTLSKPSARPPPPPTRQPSMRRADSYHRQPSVDARPRDPAPPPPPPPPSRFRASSQSSLDGQSSLDSHDASLGKSNDILADLDALRREVDALRGKMS